MGPHASSASSSSRTDRTVARKFEQLSWTSYNTAAVRWYYSAPKLLIRSGDPRNERRTWHHAEFTNYAKLQQNTAHGWQVSHTDPPTWTGGPYETAADFRGSAGMGDLRSENIQHKASSSAHVSRISGYVFVCVYVCSCSVTRG